MALPPDVKTVRITFSAGKTQVTGSDLTAELSVTPRSAVIWAATGVPLLNPTEPAVSQPGEESFVDIVNPNQAGFIDGNGNTIRDYGVSFSVRYLLGKAQVGPILTKLVKFREDDTEVDLDLLIPVTSASGTVVHIPDSWSADVLAAQQAAINAVAAAELAAQSSALDEDGKLKVSAIPEYLEEASLSNTIGTEIETVVGPIIRPEAFGAKGDGVTDDSAAVSACAAAAENQVIKFTAGKAYVLGPTVNMVAGKVRGVQGGGALLIVETGTAIQFSGTHTGTASPSQSTVATRDAEFQPFIDNLRVRGSGAGTGIRASNTQGLTISRSYFAGLAVAIDMRANNRNLTIDTTSIFYCGVGVQFYQTNIHQAIISDSHISYCGKAIYSFNSEQHNTLITGCDIETSEYSAGGVPQHLVHIVRSSTTQTHEKWQFTGNQFDDHTSLTGPMIMIDNIPESGGKFGIQYQFTGNNFSNPTAGVIKAVHAENLMVTGNSFRRWIGWAVDVQGSAQGVLVADNLFDGAALSYANGQDGVRVDSSSGALADVKVKDNLFRDAWGQSVNVSGSDTFRVLDVSGNDAVFSAHDGSIAAAFLIAAAMVQVLRFKDNGVFGPANVGAGSIAAARVGHIKDNAVTGGAGNFALPASSSTLQVSDNLWYAPAGVLSMPSSTALATTPLTPPQNLSARIVYEPSSAAFTEVMNQQGGNGSRQWGFWVLSSGALRLSTFADGTTATTVQTTGVITVVPGQKIGLRVDNEVAANRVAFYTSTDDGETWTLFERVVATGNRAISTAVAQPFALKGALGTVHSVAVYDGATPTLVEDFTDGSAAAWTLAGGAKFIEA
jgi:hypothetical protein